MLWRNFGENKRRTMDGQWWWVDSIFLSPDLEIFQTCLSKYKIKSTVIATQNPKLEQQENNGRSMVGRLNFSKSRLGNFSNLTLKN